MAKLVAVDQINPSPFVHLCPPDEENIQRMAAEFSEPGDILNPLHVVRENGRYELLSGHDRLEAAKRAGLDDVPVRDFTGSVISDDEKVSHLLRDNNERKNPDKRLGVEHVLKSHPEWSNRRIADACGCSEGLVRTVRTTLEEVGELRTIRSSVGLDGKERPARKPVTPPKSWKTDRVERGQEIIDSLPPEDQAAAASLVDQPAIPDVIGIEMLENVAEMEPDERKEVLDLHRSDDPRDKSLAKTRAFKQPANPDPRCTTLHQAELTAKRALRWCDRDPDDSFAERIKAIAADLSALSDDIHQATRSTAA